MTRLDQPRVLYIVSQLGQGGAEQQLYYLLKYLKPNGTLLSLAPGGYWLNPIRELGYPVIELRRYGSYDVRRLWAVMQVIRKQQPDIVHLFMDGVPGAYGRIATLLLRHPRVVVGIRNHPARDPYWYSLLTRVGLNHHITLFISNAISSQKYLVEHDHVPEHKSCFVPNGIELERFFPARDSIARSLLPEDWGDKVIVGTVGRLSSSKSPETFLQVARRVLDRNPTVRFLHAGDGPLREQVEHLRHALNLDGCVQFLGSRSDVPEILRTLDIFVLTSSNEGTPNVVMEAMATALPCVVTDTGDCKEIVTHGQTGFVAAVNDVEALTEHILCLANDAQLRRAYGAAGCQRIQAFGVQQMAEQYQQLYHEVMTGVKQA
ncbi:MAG: glycosyltransferase [Chloroflexi bacterium]|nr:glycosyltransferase [Chloroflexota bacterium]